MLPLWLGYYLSIAAIQPLLWLEHWVEECKKEADKERESKKQFEQSVKKDRIEALQYLIAKEKKIPWLTSTILDPSNVSPLDSTFRVTVQIQSSTFGVFLDPDSFPPELTKNNSYLHQIEVLINDHIKGVLFVLSNNLYAPFDLLKKGNRVSLKVVIITKTPLRIGYKGLCEEAAHLAEIDRIRV